MTSPQRALGRSERLYRKMLIAYPRDFRREYGDDMAQGFRDLMMSAPDGRGVWSRTIRDLFSSASKERGSAILGGGRRPSRGSLAAIAGLVVVIAMVGPGVGLVFFLVPSVILFGLPIFGVSRFYRAWLVRRTTGGAMAKQILIGVAAFVPAAVLLPFIGEDAGYWIFIAVGFTFIAGSALGIIWAVTALFKSLRDRGPSRRRWVLPVIILIPSLAILGFIIGASYNSYRNSLGPAGDHSVANASADTRALWEAANAGDVAAVVDLTTDTCADPWVKFPQGNGRHNAKGQAETRELELPDDQEPPFREIAGILGDYMDDWHHRCPQTAD